MSRASSKGKASSDSAKLDEVSVLRLVYSMRQRPEKERNSIILTVKDQLQMAIYRVISIVEKTLRAKGLFKDSVSLLNDYCAIADLIAKRTELSIVWDYLLQFYERTIDKITDSLTISFYNQLVELLQKDHKIAQETPTNLEEKRMELSSMEPGEVREERPVEKEEERVIEAAQPLMALNNEVEIVEQACVPSKQISASSMLFIESFTAGVASDKDVKGKVVKRYKVGCLQPGEPVQKWQYYDSLEGGIVKVMFTSRK